MTFPTAKKSKSKMRAQLALFDLALANPREPDAQPAPEVIAPRHRHNRKKPDTPSEPPITGTPADQTFIAFYLEHNRVPMIQDERKPWTYRGWMFWYRMLAEERRPDVVPPRWMYWFEAMDRGKLPDKPIPQINFNNDESDRTAGFKHVDNLVNIIARKLGNFTRIDPLLEWLLFAFGETSEMPDFPPELHEDLYRTFSMEHLLTKPCDYFGAWIGASKGRSNPTAFFATPHPIVQLMTSLLMADGSDRSATVYEPSLGTGRMLLHASNYSLRLSGQDIDRTVIMASKVNGFLYVPWLVRPFPESFFNNPTPLATEEETRNAE